MIAWLVLTPQRLLSASFADLFISVNLLKLFVRWMNEFMVQSTPALRTPRGGGVLPYISYTGMCSPTGS